MTGEPDAVAAAWDAEYRGGRYVGDPPVGFTADILAAAQAQQATTGVYLGCGSGRNLVPLLDAGLDLIGVDIAAVAIDQLRQRRPDRAGRLIHGDLAALPAGQPWPLVIGIQVFILAAWSVSSG
jgi:predicted TPR repeat methyltransferase